MIMKLAIKQWAIMIRLHLFGKFTYQTSRVILTVPIYSIGGVGVIITGNYNHYLSGFGRNLANNNQKKEDKSF